MHRSLRLSLLLSVFLLSACQAGAGTGTGGSSSSAALSSPSSVSSADAQARTIRVVATNWAFTPSTITAKVGEKVRLELVGESGNHGIGVPALGLDVKFNEGQTVTVDLPTDKAGVYPFRCNVLCGEGHFDMMGTIIIE